MELEQGTTIDRYRVVGVIGRGGIAVVYRVEHDFLGSSHALKLVLSPRAATRERLMQEGRAQSQLRHRNIVAVTDVISVFGAPGLVMEFIEGPSLDQFLNAERLTLAQADALARGILAGVSTAHAAGVLHRDLKPANILLQWEDDAWIPKIADFGVAKIANEQRLHQTRTGAGLGTPRYMAPEQTRDASRVDERADVFAIGAILYELVTGEQAFSGTDIVELFEHIRAGEHGPLPEGLPERMTRAILGALEPDPELRVPSIEALAAIWRDGEPLTVPEWPKPDLEAPRVSATSSSQASQTFGFTRAPAGSASSPTLEPDLGSSETLDVAVLASTTAPPSMKARRWPWLVGALAVGALLGAVALWPAETTELTATSVPALYADSAAQELLAETWAATLDADFVRAERLATALTTRHVATPTAHALLAMIRAGQGQGGPAHQAMWKAVELADQAPGVHAEALRIQGKARRKGWENALGPMVALAEAHPDDLLVQWIGTWTLPPEHADVAFDRVEAMAKAAPDAIYPYTQSIAVASNFGRHDQAQQRVDAAIQRFPDHPVVHLLAAEVAVAQRQLPKARDHLTEALRFAPGLFGARHRLAEVALLLGDESQAEALVAASMSPSEPMSQRAAFSYRMGLAYAGLGRVDEGFARFRAGAALAEAEGDYVTKGWLLGMIALIELDAERFDRAADHVQTLLSFAATTPEIPEGERAAMSRSLLEARAFIAARRGDVEEARTLLARVEAIEGVRQSSVEWVKRDLASHAGDVEALEGLFEHAQPGCLGAWEKARALALAGANEAARTEVEALLDSGSCGPVGAQRWANALALELAVRLSGDPAVRASHINAFDQLWPRPDADLPVVQRLEQLRAEP